MKNDKSAYLYIAPIYIFFLIYIAYPLLFTIQTSFYEWNGMSSQKIFVGLQNFINIFHDGILLIILKNFVVFGVLVVGIQMLLGLVFAVILKSGLPYSGFFKTVIFMPVVLTSTIIGFIFSKIFEYNFGFLNVFLRAIHLDFLALQWLADPKIAIFTVAAVNIWQWTGFSMIMYMAGLSAISEEMFEAAKIDGAGKIKTFFSITWPMLTNTHFTLTILGAIGVLNTFDIVYVLTNGGPLNSTQFFATYIFQKTFLLYDAGSAAAISIICLVIALIFTVIQNIIYNSKVNEV
jgi:raffinose/stachyose/melibiose transport system permease protein